MYPRDHNPPHFHVIYGEFSAQVRITSGTIIGGELPIRVKRLVDEWLAVHRIDLIQAWQLMQEGKSANEIAPLG